MIGDKKVHALLMIREGSKRIPDKAFLEINGKPLIKIAVDKSLNNEYIDKVYISTSGKLYKSRIKDYGCTIIDRPESLSEDNVVNLPVFRHAINFMELGPSDYFVFVDFTKPFLSDNQICLAIEFMKYHGHKSVFTCKRVTEEIVDCNGGIVGTGFNIRFGSIRIYEKQYLLSSPDDVYGQSLFHKNLAIVEDWEIDLNYPWQIPLMHALIDYGYKYE